MTNKSFGNRGEYLARLFLEEKGFVFIRANYRTKHGEIDLIMQENDEIVFVEVKTRTVQSAKQFGRGADRIDDEKRRHILRASRVFIYEEPRLTKNLFPRYDAIELYLDSQDANKVRVLHTPCAFG
ncbi:MAG: YraN family protein, partial [Clostridia bacterium]|nr:YraN family protein [Clostridia bacterium]